MKNIFKIVLYVLPLMSYASTPIADYRMDECSWNGTAGEVVDQSGNYDAKVDIANSATTVDKHIINRSGAFNQGSTDNSAVSIPPSVLDGKRDFTFTVWLYPTSNLESKDTFLSAENGDNTDDDDLLFRIKNDNDHINLKYDGKGNNSNGDQIEFSWTKSDIPTNQWTFVALTKSDNTACVTINETRDCQNVPEGQDPLSIKYLLLGQDSAGGASQKYYANSAFPGYMDEVKFFDTNLSEAELKTIYDNEKDAKNYDGSSREEVMCPSIAEYRMDECYWDGTVDEVKDSSKNHYDAKVDLANTATSTETEKVINRAGSFNNGNEKSAISLNTDILNGKSNFTFTTWLYPTKDLETKNTFLSAEHTSGDDDDLLFRINGDNINFKYAANGKQNNFSLNKSEILKDAWTFIALAKNDNNVCVAINDSEFECITIDDGTKTLNLSDSNASLILAQDRAKGDYYVDSAFVGYMDEVKFFDSQLTKNQLKNIYNNEKEGKNYDGSGPRAASPSCVCVTANSKLSHLKWKLISFPCNTGDNGIENLLGDANDVNGLGKYGEPSDGGRWVMYEQSGTDSYEVNDKHKNTNKTKLIASSKVTPGKGYWIIIDAGGDGNEKNLTIDTTLSGLSYTSTVDISSVSITDDNFTKVLEYDLPKTSDANDKKYMAGNPFPYPFLLDDLYFKHDTLAYKNMSNPDNDTYIDPTFYKHDSQDTDSVNGYTAVNSGTPGFDGGGIRPMEGVFIKIEKNSDTKDNKFAYPLMAE